MIKGIVALLVFIAVVWGASHFLHLSYFWSLVIAFGGVFALRSVRKR